MVCPNCGFNNTDDAAKCLICQAPLQNPQTAINTNVDPSNNNNYYEESPKKKLNILPIILIIVAVIIIGIGIIYFVFFSKPKYTSSVTFGSDRITTLYGIYPNITVQSEMACGDTCLNIYYARAIYSDNVNKEYENSLKNNNFTIFSIKNSDTSKITKFVKNSVTNGKVLVVTVTINTQAVTIKYELLSGSIDDLIEKELQ
jgi:flagellar basal body-associated protein FliL